MFNDRFDAKTMNDVAKQAREEESKHKASDFIAVIKRQIKKRCCQWQVCFFSQCVTVSGSPVKLFRRQSCDFKGQKLFRNKRFHRCD